MSVRARACLFALIAVVALPASAAGAAEVTIYSEVLHAYQSHGMVPPCEFTANQLERALKGQDTYSTEYGGELTVAIQDARAARASGACAPERVTPAGAAKAPPAGGGGSVPLISVTGATNAPLPAPIVLMAVLAGALALVGGSLALARARGWDPDWALRWRHACSEAGYRLGGTRAKLADRIRRAPR